MAVAILASTYKQGNSGGCTSDAINISGASLVVIIVDAFTGVSLSVTDNASNTPVSAVAGTDGVEVQTIYYIESPTTSASYQVTAAGTGSFASLYVLAVSGTAASSSLDKTAQNGAGGGTSVAAGPVTTTTDGQLIVSGNDVGNTDDPSVSGVTEDGTGLPIINSVSFGIHAGTLIQTNAGALTATWSWSSNGRNVATLATFKAAAGGGGGVFVPIIGRGPGMALVGPGGLAGANA